MSTKHEIKVSFTPLCTSCGSELAVGFTESKPTNHPFDRDDPWNRVDQRVFVHACEKCFLHKNESVAGQISAAPDLLEALKAARAWMDGKLDHAEIVGAIILADVAIAKAEGKS